MNGILHDQKAFRTKRLRTKIIQIITAVFLLAGIWLPASAATVMIVGDSLSDAYGLPRQSGWVHQLTERWDGRHEVVNASISGETTAGALSRIEALLERHRPDLMVVILGGNDGLRGLAPNQTEDNLAALIEKGKAADARVALMQIRMPANMGPVYIQRFESVFPRLAESLNVQLLPFFLDGIFDRPGMMQADGIHPTAEAQSLMLEALLPALEALLAEPSRD
ncbi:MAG TPA: arylesterase [Wenzhouxiangella sp.]|nr:arylesterase [Wenzhouxiangella sp.]